MVSISIEVLAQPMRKDIFILGRGEEDGKDIALRGHAMSCTSL